jgi:DivIVA domain-containing protein
VATALIYLVVMAFVAAVVYLIAVFVFGRGEELAPLPPGASPTRLPAGEVYGEDIRSVRFQQTLRGYKMSEVDWVLTRLSTELDELRTRVAELEGDGPVEPGEARVWDTAADLPADDEPDLAETDHDEAYYGDYDAEATDHDAEYDDGPESRR